LPSLRPAALYRCGGPRRSALAWCGPCLLCSASCRSTRPFGEVWALGFRARDGARRDPPVLRLLLRESTYAERSPPVLRGHSAPEHNRLGWARRSGSTGLQHRVPRRRRFLRTSAMTNSPTRVTPNQSFEPTSKSLLRKLSAAAQLQRYAPRKGAVPHAHPLLVRVRSAVAEAAAQRLTIAAAVLALSGCASPIPTVSKRLPLAAEVCSRVPLGVSLEAASATALERDGTLLMGGSRELALFALRMPKNCGCRVQLSPQGSTVASQAQCA
jgi:hypothetical protein